MPNNFYAISLQKYIFYDIFTALSKTLHGIYSNREPFAVILINVQKLTGVMAAAKRFLIMWLQSLICSPTKLDLSKYCDILNWWVNK